jgi:hypothetical protein
MMRECICADCGEPFRPARAYHQHCWPCWQEANRPTEKRPASVVRQVPVTDQGTLRAAVALCHPDRHPVERQQLATETTGKLLEALERTRQLERAA